MPTFRLKRGLHWEGHELLPNTRTISRELLRWLFDMNIKWYLKGNDIIIPDADQAVLFKMAWM